MKELFLHNILFKLFIIITTCGLIYKILNFFVSKERQLYKYKIKYFILNLFCCILYSSFFIILISIIRTRVLDKDINLFALYINCKTIVAPLSIINVILLILSVMSIIILITIVIKEINEFFINQIIKIYIYSLYGTQKGQIVQSNIRDISIKAFYVQLYHFSLDILHYIGKIEGAPQMFSRFFYICKCVVTKLPSFLILLYFVYEIKYNHGVLSSKFNSWLFIYFLFSLYGRITNYTTFSNNTINEMVFNMYYRDRSIKYVNMPKIWENAVYKYVDEGMSFNTINELENFENKIGLLEFLNGMFWKHTWKSTDGYNYLNFNGEDFQEENNQSIDVVHYPYTENDETFNKNINDTIKIKK